MTRLLIVGNSGGTNVGSSLLRAASKLQHVVHLVDVARAYAAPRWMRHLSWRLLEHRPPRLAAFCREVLSTTVQVQAEVIITTGHCPLTHRSLSVLRESGARLVHYSTDDPWNETQRASWFLRTLPLYDAIYSTREANLDDFRALGCRSVQYLPFGFDPHLFYPEPDVQQGASENAKTVLFVGGADADRVPFMSSLLKNGIDLRLHGDYWDRHAETQASSRGHADPDVVRQATTQAAINLCLVRRTNRDGHVMRSFEIPACGGCMLAEETAEHCQLFGNEGDAVLYFKSVPSAISKIRYLSANPEERVRLSTAARQLVTTRGHTYEDRLRVMLGAAGDRLRAGQT